MASEKSTQSKILDSLDDDTQLDKGGRVIPHNLEEVLRDLESKVAFLMRWKAEVQPKIDLVYEEYAREREKGQPILRQAETGRSSRRQAEPDLAQTKDLENREGSLSLQSH